MKKQKQYRYIGRNGIVTSKVLLDGINHIPMMHLEAEPGYLLTDGNIRTRAILIEEENINQWYEIVDNNKKEH